VLTLFPVEHTSVLDRAVVEYHLVEFPSTGRSNRLGGSLTALDRNVVENLRSLPGRDSIRDNAPRVVLRSAGHLERHKSP
jgi:hypothetical protein